MFGAVEGECFDRGAATGGDSDYLAAGPSKMMVPFLDAWIEEPHRTARLRITSRLPGAFAKRTMNAGKRQIGERGRPSSYHRHNVIDVKGRGLPQLRKSAVFAAVRGARLHPPTQSCGNRHRLRLRGFDLRSQLQDGQRAGQLRETFGFFFLG